MQEFVIHLLGFVLVMRVDMALIVQVRICNSFPINNFYDSLKCILSFAEFDCPGDGLCSNQGTCDDTIGSCVCNEGFEGNTCAGDNQY